MVFEYSLSGKKWVSMEVRVELIQQANDFRNMAGIFMQSSSETILDQRGYRIAALVI